MSIHLQVDEYMKIAININKALGGTRGYEAEAKKQDNFNIIRQNVHVQLHSVKKKLEEIKYKKKSQIDNIKVELNQKMDGIYELLDKMRQGLSSHQSQNVTLHELKSKIIEQLSEQAATLQQIIDGQDDNIKKLLGDDSLAYHSNDTYTDKRQRLLDQLPQDSNLKRKPQKLEATEIQMTALKRFKQKDELIDKKLSQVAQITKQWKYRVKQAENLIDETGQRVQNLNREVDLVSLDLMSSNKRLKDVVTKFRKPHKFCLDVILILLLIGFLVGIIKLTT